VQNWRGFGGRGGGKGKGGGADGEGPRGRAGPGAGAGGGAAGRGGGRIEEVLGKAATLMILRNGRCFRGAALSGLRNGSCSATDHARGGAAVAHGRRASSWGGASRNAPHGEEVRAHAERDRFLARPIGVGRLGAGRGVSPGGAPLSSSVDSTEQATRIRPIVGGRMTTRRELIAGAVAVARRAPGRSRELRRAMQQAARVLGACAGLHGGHREGRRRRHGYGPWFRPSGVGRGAQFFRS